MSRRTDRVMIGFRARLSERLFLKKVSEVAGMSFEGYLRDAAFRAAEEYLADLEEQHEDERGLLSCIRRSKSKP